MPTNKKDSIQINLTSDNKELDDSLKDSESLINSFGKKVQASFEKTAEISKTLGVTVKDTFINGVHAVQDFTSSIADSIAASETFNSIWNKSSFFFSQFSHKLQSVVIQNKDLERTIKLTGKASGYSADSLKKYAEYLEKVTKFSASANIGAMQLIAHFRNIHGEEFKEAIKVAQDLATELRIDLNSAAQTVAQSLNDPIAAISQLSSMNIFFTKSEEKAIKAAMAANNVILAQNLILGKLNENFEGAAKAAGNTFYGRLERLKNMLSTIGTTIGQKILASINKLWGEGKKGINTFEAFLKKIEEWGQVAVAAVDVVLPKIVDFIRNININFESVYEWLINATMTTFTAVQNIFVHAGEIFGSVNQFIFASFTKVWSNISNIFTDVIPKSFIYMKDIFMFTIDNIIGNIKVFWHRLKAFSSAGWENFKLELIKWGVWILKWAIRIGINFIPYVKQLLWPIKFLFGDVLGRVLNAAEERVDEYIDSFKEKYPSLTAGMEVRNPFENVQAPSFDNSLNSLNQMVDLSQEWGTLMANVSNNFGIDFQNNISANRKSFDGFLTDIKNKSKNTKLFEEPKLLAENERLKDEKEKENKHFQGGVSGLEEFWYKQSSDTDKNTAAIKENTKAIKDLTKTDEEIKNEAKAASHKKEKENKAEAYKKERGRRREEQKEKERRYKLRHAKIVLSPEEQKKKDEKKERQKIAKKANIDKRKYGITDEEEKELASYENRRNEKGEFDRTQRRARYLDRKHKEKLAKLAEIAEREKNKPAQPKKGPLSEKELLAKINNERRERGLKELTSIKPPQHGELKRKEVLAKAKNNRLAAIQRDEEKEGQKRKYKITDEKEKKLASHEDQHNGKSGFSSTQDRPQHSDKKQKKQIAAQERDVPVKQNKNFSYEKELLAKINNERHERDLKELTSIKPPQHGKLEKEEIFAKTKADRLAAIQKDEVHPNGLAKQQNQRNNQHNNQNQLTATERRNQNTDMRQAMRDANRPLIAEMRGVNQNTKQTNKNLKILS